MLTGCRRGGNGAPVPGGTGLMTGAPGLPVAWPRGGGVILVRTGLVSGVSGGPEVGGMIVTVRPTSAMARPGRGSGGGP